MEKRAIVVKTMGGQGADGAIVIRAKGNPQMAGAIIDGIKPSVIPLTKRELAVVQTELARHRARQCVKRPYKAQKWQRFQMELQRKYEIKQHSIFYNIMLLLWAICTLFIFTCWKRLGMWIREVWR